MVSEDGEIQTPNNKCKVP